MTPEKLEMLGALLKVANQMSAMCRGGKCETIEELQAEVKFEMAIQKVLDAADAIRAR